MNKILSVLVVLSMVLLGACGVEPEAFVFDSVYQADLTTVETTCEYGQKGATTTVVLQVRTTGHTVMVDVIDARSNVDTFVGTADADGFVVSYVVNAGGSIVNNELRGYDFATDPTVELAQHIVSGNNSCHILSGGAAQ